MTQETINNLCYCLINWNAAAKQNTRNLYHKMFEWSYIPPQAEEIREMLIKIEDLHNQIDILLNKNIKSQK